MHKDEYPKAVADLLGIPPVAGIAGPWMSNQGTVLKEWLMAVGEALDIPYAGEKTRMMRLLIEAVGGTWDPTTMASTETLSGGGGNISTPAFEALLSGLKTQAAAQRRIASNEGRGPFEPASSPSITDDRTVLRAIRERAGQPRFRAGLLDAYGGQCAVTGWDASASLEAAHVVAYGAGGTYDVTNGLLLRADIHTLFDLGLLAFDASRRAVLHHELAATRYAPLQGSQLADPSPRSLRVPDASLAQHRAAAGL